MTNEKLKQTQHRVSGFWSVLYRLANLPGQVKEGTLQQCPASYGRNSGS